MSKINLLDYQQKAVDKFFSNDKGLLAGLPTGTGKTVVGLAIIEKLFEKDRNIKVLIICPANLRFNFKESIKSFHLNNIKADIVSEPKDYQSVYQNNNIIIISYNFMILHPEMIKKDKYNLLISDEFHRAKNLVSNTYKRLYDIRVNIPLMLSLSASYVSNTLQEFLTLVSIISEDKRIIHLADQFIKIGYVNDPHILLKLFFGAKPSEPYPAGLKNIVAFRNMVGKWIYIPKDESIEKSRLTDKKPPEPIRHVENIDISKFEYDAYRYVIGKLPKQYIELLDRDKLSENDFKKIGKVIIMSAQQVLLTPDYILNINPENARPGSKILYLRDKIKSTENKSIIFTPFTNYGAIITNKTLIQSGIKSKLYIGDTPEEERARIRKEFENGNLQNICLTMAGTEGLNLPSCNDIYFLSMTYNPEIMEQVMGRALRITSLNQYVNVYYLIAKFHEKTTIDQNILTISERKKIMKFAIKDVLSENMDDIDENGMAAAGLTSYSSFQPSNNKIINRRKLQ